ncbi:hypothetical protein [Staphylococcus phage vB_ScaM-V1SC01]|nr:hypothetical protein [Staphylococcus phage vB_ScaM-V1SC01]WPH67149.1 hypothetical protein CUBB_gp233c [Staphylococcus phage CUB-B]
MFFVILIISWFQVTVNSFFKLFLFRLEAVDRFPYLVS